MPSIKLTCKSRNCFDMRPSLKEKQHDSNKTLLCSSLPVSAHLQGCELAEDDVVCLFGQLIFDGRFLCATQHVLLQDFVQSLLSLMSLHVHMSNNCNKHSSSWWPLWFHHASHAICKALCHKRQGWKKTVDRCGIYLGQLQITAVSPLAFLQRFHIEVLELLPVSHSGWICPMQQGPKLSIIILHSRLDRPV